ncbi:GGDEF domain-containing protein [Inediibacterium massiliense]|uniref:GGDEF domain-containing protein n=1 Tax=Inediibacterium massiliense TaxID=1658111 RepID=UPI0006B3F93B|nr:diguanylate cyclase [Inediibacterium massiliense]
MPKDQSSFDVSTFINKNEWSKKILDYGWIGLGLSFLGACMSYLLYHRGNIHYIQYHILLPAFLLAILILATETFLKAFDSSQDKIIITASCIFITILSYFHMEFHILKSAYILSMLISVFYFKLKNLIFALILNIFCIVFTFSIHPYMSKTAFAEDLMVIILVLFMSFFICKGILEKEQSILYHTYKNIQSKQELLIENIFLEKDLKIDRLTGLYNHRSFHEYLDILLEQANQHPFPIHLAILDIDNFKKVNDEYGHRVGDLVLERIGKIIRENLSPNDFPFRYGGEEFAILFTEVSTAFAYMIVEKIRSVVSNTYHKELNGKSITLSIGLESFQIGMDKQTLFENADAYLYLAKKGGKNRTVINNL